jgi:hypothetical protein
VLGVETVLLSFCAAVPRGGEQAAAHELDGVSELRALRAGRRRWA